ncbi:hypothetical protein [Winogradskyella sp.]|uniref:hypothetical protein n=1 Tax=Winogradskyella sp. TaxID=1883156 RepID=UPI0025FB0B45|nr:hypothetical protein [Winogradskyella sp.]
MKNVRFIFVLLLFVNCTTDSAEVDETSETINLQPESQICVDDLPKVRLSNNSAEDFDFIVYTSSDFSMLHTQNISSTDNSGWLELSHNDVIVLATNSIVYGQKIQLNLQACDNVELEIDANNVLVASIN